ncbi:MAG: PAS domain S-box protein [Candidatus Methylomirabilales bacterium]
MPDDRMPDLLFSAASPAHEAQGTRYPDLAELLPQIVYEMDVQGKLTFANRHAFKLLGYTREDFERGLNVVDLLAPEDRARGRARIQAVLQGAISRGTQFTVLKKDGSRLPVLIYSAPILQGDRPIGLRGILVDISDRVEAEAAIRESEEKYRVLFEMESDAIFLIDNETGQIVEVNSAACTLYGYSREELLARRNVDLSAEPDATQAATRQHLSHVALRYHRKKDGSLFPVEIAARHLLWRGRDAHIAAIRDITDRKRAEDALVKRTQQLEAVRHTTGEIIRELDLTALLGMIARQTMALVEASQCTVFLWDDAAGVLRPRAWHGYVAPDTWLEHVCLRLGEAVAGTAAQHRRGVIVNDYRTSPEAHPLVLQHTRITAALAEPLLYRDRLVGVLLVNREGGERRFTQEDHETVSLFAVQAAIAIENAGLFAELNRSYESLQHAQDEMIRSEKLRALGQMAAGVAHELNNVLAIILGQAELLRLRATDPELEAALTPLETAAADGAHVVRRLQDFARQRTTVPLAPVGLDAVAAEALQLTRPRWKDEPERRGTAIQVRTALTDLPAVLGCAPEIREALINVILNAVDAMPNGGALTLRGGQRDGWVEVQVSDTGTGMPEEVRRRVFDPFYTTKGGQGTGLGLSVVHGIMERHGGRIEVASAPGQGTRFTLCFRPAPAGTPDAPRHPRRGSRPRRILLVDDDAGVRETLAALLQTVGHTVIEAESGAAGLQRIREEPVDLVITDLGMPGMNGYDVARAVKAEHPEVGVILITGWGEQTTADPTISGLVDRVIGKPLSLQTLLTAIEPLVA